MQTVDIQLFKNNSAFTVTLGRWGVTKKIPKNAAVQTPETQQSGAKKSRIKESKILIVSPEYDAIVTHQGETRRRCELMSVPSFFKKGFMLVRNTGIEKLEKYLQTRVAEQAELVEKFLSVYPEAIRQSAEDLKGLWDAKDYPSIPALEQRFNIRWNWIAFGIPDQLPKEIFEAEKAKAEAVWKDAGDQIMLALRGGFKKLVDHAVDRLTVEPGQPPKKIFDTMIGNIVEFIDLFGDRNITNDAEMEALVTKAKEVVTGLSPDDLRKDENARNNTLAGFTAIAQNLDLMIEQMPSRKFSFDDAEEA
jgi:hypothetical protein